MQPEFSEPFIAVLWLKTIACGRNARSSGRLPHLFVGGLQGEGSFATE